MKRVIAFPARILAASWGQAFSALVLLVTIRLFTQELGPEPFGAAMLGLGIISLVDGVSTTAYSQSLAQILKDRPTHERRSLALGMGLWLSAFVGVLCAAGVVLAGIAYGWQSAAAVALVAPAFCLAEGVRAGGQMIVLLGRRYGVVSSWAATEALCIAGASLAAIRLMDGDPVSLVVGMLAGRTISTVLCSQFALGRIDHWSADRRQARDVIPAAIAFGWPVAVMTPLAWIGIFADRYIVGYSLGLTEAGVLAALAGAITRPYGIVSAGLTNVFRPDLLDLAAGRPPAHSRPLLRWAITAIGIGLAGIAAAAIVGPWLVDFLISFATPQIDERALITLLAASQMLLLVTHALDNQLLALGRSRQMLVVLMIVTALGLPLIAIGALTFGLVGAAAARVLSEGMKLSGAALLVARARRTTTGGTIAA